MSPPEWVSAPPSAFDIVTAYFPETKPKGELRPRPSLVTKVFRGSEGGTLVEIAYGTKHLKLIQRRRHDLIIQNSTDLANFGLAVATRFNLDELVRLPWHSDFFACWTGRNHPRIGSLTEEYIKDYAYLMMMRSA